MTIRRSLANVALLAGLLVGFDVSKADENPPQNSAATLSGATVSASTFSFHIDGTPKGSAWQVYSTANWTDDWSLVGTVTLSGSDPVIGSANVSDNSITGVSRRFYFLVRVVNGTPVYSRGIGFARVTAFPGLTMIANPLSAAPDDKLASVFGPSSLPAGSALHKWNGTGFDLYSWNGSAWSNPNTTLTSGEGAFINNNSGAAFTVTFVGLVPEGNLVKTLPPGYSLVGSLTAQGGGISSVLGYAAADSDAVLPWDQANQTYSQYFEYLDGWGWYDGQSPNPSEPVLSVGTGVFLYNAWFTRTWTKHFSIAERFAL
jgi:hypothetical protein